MHCTYDCNRINVGIVGGVAAGLEGSSSRASPPLLGTEVCSWPLSVARDLPFSAELQHTFRMKGLNAPKQICPVDGS